MKDRKRVVLDLTPAVHKQINDMKESIGVKSNAELIRYALGLLALTDKHLQDGYTLQFSKDDEIVRVTMPTLG